MIRGSRDIEAALLNHLGVKRNGLYLYVYLLQLKNNIFGFIYILLTSWLLVKNF